MASREVHPLRQLKSSRGMLLALVVNDEVDKFSLRKNCLECINPMFLRKRNLKLLLRRKTSVDLLSFLPVSWFFLPLASMMPN
jgi:hypothetical protein